MWRAVATMSIVRWYGPGPKTDVISQGIRVAAAPYKLLSLFDSVTPFLRVPGDRLGDIEYYFSMYGVNYRA
jgi:hypothetical protein